MNTKKWSTLAQVLIALGCVGGLMGIARGLADKNILSIVFGIASFVIFWSVYQFKPWALKGLTILLSLDILFVVVSIVTGGVPVVLGVIALGIKGMILYYFNSKPIKVLFAGQGQEGK
ncbi:MAG TPA: hypothetical protein VLJ10_00915 [Candidatus Bathyarchaeia archaeon]|nr:hypothetical protein [Candidatus Bathyarchaeia archaeon]